MRIIAHLIFSELHVQFRNWIILLILAALSMAGLLVSLNLAISHSVDNQVSTKYVATFFISFIVLIFSHRNFTRSTAKLFSSMIYIIRSRIVENILKLTLRDIEFLNPEKIQSQLVSLSQNIIYSSSIVSIILLNFMICIIVLFYLLSISVWVFLFSSICLVLSFFYFYRLGKARMIIYRKMMKTQDEFLTSVQYLVKGFRDIKLNHTKARRSLESYTKEAHQLQTISFKSSTEDLYAKGQFETIFFALTAACVYVLPNTSIDRLDIVMIVTSVIFILPVVFVSFVFASFLEIVVTDFNELGNLYFAVKEKTSSNVPLSKATQYKPKLVSKITLKDLYFSYDEKSNYSFGPVNLTIHKGETLFVIGGNGSGKSTLLKLLTGLYLPTSGAIIWDDTSVSAYNLNTYRELFSVVFTDFHLFEKIYGIEKINEEHVNHLLNLMELANVTHLEGNKFSSLRLSTGQKKRMAMLQVFLDNKEIYILDEVAADQDPHYRSFFYHTVLPELKKAGKTTIIVSHDDNYFHTADRIVEIKNGKASRYQGNIYKPKKGWFNWK